MAKLFLSYSRRDGATARRFTNWLERQGHEVWRDEDDIGGGASFSSEIEKALKDCGAVLVLWSAHSVQSTWVRDEAGYGRDAGKLIPFSLDGTEPPLGFRQFQAISLLRWKGHRDPPDADRIRTALARIADGQRTALPPQPTRSGGKAFRRALLGGGIITIVSAAGLGLLLWEHWSGSGQISIAVLAASQASDRAMAVDYANAAAADMAGFLPRRFDGATIIAPADAVGQTSDYRMSISTDPRGAGANATLTLTDSDGRTTLWSQNWSVADASAADLKGAVSAAASKAAFCLMQAKGGSTRLSQPALGLYLNGCTGLAGSRLSNEDYVTIFERVTKLAPDFGPGWDYLALSRSWIAQGLEDRSPAAYSAALKSARDAIAVARKLNPNSAMSYDAEYHINSRDTFRALQLLEQGAKIDPNDPRIQMHLSSELRAVGRMVDAVQAAQNGVELEPGSSFNTYQYIVALIYSGQFSRAKSEIVEARKKWPNDSAMDLAEFNLQFPYGDARAAMQLLPRIAHSSDANMVPYRKLIDARLNPTQKNIDDAVAALNARPSTDPGSRNDVLAALGNFGRVADAYQLLENPAFQPFIDRSLLFRPDFAGIRADPRFMRVAGRIGLVRYWLRSGYWPDFCSTEQLKYECKKAAAEYMKRVA